MNNMKQKFIYWSPRILSLLFVIFISVFALDVFSEKSGWEVIPALLIHLSVPLLLLVGVILAWRNDLIGIMAFLAFIVWYFYQAGFDRDWTVYALIVAPPLVISFLYWLSWRQLHRRN